MMKFVIPLCILLIISSFTPIIESQRRSRKKRSKNSLSTGLINEDGPSVVMFSIYTGDVVAKYDYFEMTLESMRNNPTVDFVLVNIVTQDSDVIQINEMKKSLNLPNFYVDFYTSKDLSKRVKLKLGIDVPFNKTWGRKLCDYKVTYYILGHRTLYYLHRFTCYISFTYILLHIAPHSIC